MKPLSSFRAAVGIAVLLPSLFVFVSATGCAAPPVAQAGTKATVLTSRGGIAYDATAPLDAKVTPKFDTANPPAEVLTYNLTYQGGDKAVVPALLTVPTKATGKLPAVLLLHGLGGKKEDVYLLATALSRKGYVTLSIDIAGHNARPKVNGKELWDFGPQDLRTLVGQTVADLRRGTDYLVSRPDVDPQRIGFVGVSLGGITGGVLAGDEPRLKAMALWAAGGDWGKILTATTEAHVQHFRARTGGQNYTADEMNQILGDVDPLGGVKRARSRPMLFLYGDTDTVVPTETENALFTATKEPKTRHVLHGGHIPDVLGMVATTMSWLDENLKK